MPPGADSEPAKRYEIRFQPAARRAFSDRLPESVAAAVLEFCDAALAVNPHRVGKPLFGPWPAATEPAGEPTGSFIASKKTCAPCTSSTSTAEPRSTTAQTAPNPEYLWPFAAWCVDVAEHRSLRWPGWSPRSSLVRNVLVPASAQFPVRGDLWADRFEVPAAEARWNRASAAGRTTAGRDSWAPGGCHFREICLLRQLTHLPVSELPWPGAGGSG